MCGSLCDERVAVYWCRDKGDYPRYLRILNTKTQRLGKLVTTGYKDECGPNIQENRILYLWKNDDKSDQILVVERAGVEKLVVRHGKVKDLVVDLDDGIEIAGRCGTDLEVHKLANGFVVIGGVFLGGAAGHPGFVVYDPKEKRVVKRAEITKLSTYQSFGAAGNTVVIFHKRGAVLWEVEADGDLSNQRKSIDLKGLHSQWYNGTTVTIGNGRLVQLYCEANNTTLLVCDTKQKNVSEMFKVVKLTQP